MILGKPLNIKRSSTKFHKPGMSNIVLNTFKIPMDYEHSALEYESGYPCVIATKLTVFGPNNE